MKRNWIVIAFTLLLTVALWAQTSTPAPKADAKAAGCACCQMGDKAAAHHDMKDMKADAKGHDHAAMNHAGMSCCAGKDAKDGMACSRKDKDAKGGCCAGMKQDAKATADAKTCGKDCCKDGKCTMAKNGQKCCDKCPMAEKTATGA